MSKYRFLVLGTEGRQVYLTEMLQNLGHQVVASEDGIDEEFDAYLLPVPTSAKYYEKIRDRISSGSYVFGCNIPADSQLKNQTDNIHFIEYMKSDSVAYKNAVATAEGTIAEAMRLSMINLHQSQVLVTGFGRCGEILAHKLQGLDCHVTVMDRKAVKRAKAQACGYEALSFDLEEFKFNDPKKYDFLFNTVPGQVIGEQMLSDLSEQIYIFDIASKPGGVDYEYCKMHHISATLLPGLPGKYAPKTSAKVLLEVIEENMGKL